MVAGRDFAHCGADLLDDARSFVTEHDRQRHRIDLVANDDIGVAHAGRDDPHQHFVGARFLDGERFDLERPAFAANDRSFDLMAAIFGMRHVGHFNPFPEFAPLPGRELQNPLIVARKCATV